MSMHPRAGTRATAADLIDVAELVSQYYSKKPDISIPEQRVIFGTSGHRGSSLNTSFNETHIHAITIAIVEYRNAQGISGPLFIGNDPHALSAPARETALRVLLGHGLRVFVDSENNFVPTPAVSHAILRWNNTPVLRAQGEADGIVVTPSHNPPQDGGFKYNPPHGGPADSDATSWIANRANKLIATGLPLLPPKLPTESLLPTELPDRTTTAEGYDYCGEYVNDLINVIDMAAIKDAGVKIGADPLGGAAITYWGAIRDRYQLNLTVLNEVVDPRWPFMTLDWDGKIRMDPSSPFAMASVLQHIANYEVVTGNDADSDRHGIVTPDAGLMNPNHFLAVAVDYLFTHRPGWAKGAAVGKTLVSSSMIDRVSAALNLTLWEVPVGFKWFVPGLIDGSIGFGGEESAGASFLRLNGRVWTTDKDGIILCLLAAEIKAVTGKSPSERYRELVAQFGEPAYERIDSVATPGQKALLAKLSGDQISATELAGQPITARISRAPGNGAAIGGVKVETADAWFAARPSGTEDVYKIYAESFLGTEHLHQVQEDARRIVSAAIEV